MIGDNRYLIIRRILESAGGTPLPGDLETDLLEKYLVIIGGTPVPGDDFNVLLRKIVIAKGGDPAPGDDEWDLLVKWLMAEGECRACGDSIYDLWRKILEMEEPTAPEVRVQQEDDLGSISIFDGQGEAVDFGSVVEGGATVSIVFTVFNDGDADLTLGAVSVPAGYTLTEALSGTITPGNSDSFTVRLDNVSTGVKAGNISFSTNDEGENPFDFPVTGTVTLSLLNNLIAHWRMDEASGERVDVHGGNNLADLTTVGQAVGIIDSAANFVAANSEALSIADNAAVSMGDIDFTIAGWVFLNSLGASGIVGKWASGSLEYLLYFTGVEFSFHVSNDGVANISRVNPTAVSTGTWYFVVGWHDSVANTTNIQVNDGTLASGAHTTGVHNGAATLYVGLLEDGLAYFNGRVDSLSIWKRVLTADERTSLYNFGNGLNYPF